MEQPLHLKCHSLLNQVSIQPLTFTINLQTLLMTVSVNSILSKIQNQRINNLRIHHKPAIFWNFIQWSSQIFKVKAVNNLQLLRLKLILLIIFSLLLMQKNKVQSINKKSKSNNKEKRLHNHTFQTLYIIHALKMLYYNFLYWSFKYWRSLKSKSAN